MPRPDPGLLTDAQVDAMTALNAARARKQKADDALRAAQAEVAEASKLVNTAEEVAREVLGFPYCEDCR